jgi:hypothetical protein
VGVSSVVIASRIFARMSSKAVEVGSGYLPPLSH